ncbi:carbohydrate ABC transporter permease [Paenibacillus sp.]|uniref:carbohydrate ABC transporter permease n=1 Tax=Paenibacillus sp. TaxID=58172 RepID=UPI002D6E33B2|nr:carbohydrate ABC transporter permease [Paenibacillus sp.]HZG57946.1 carbohydrate ABC transporter permease [Paenibacillus sp.]
MSYRSERWFEWFNAVALILIALSMLAPLVHLLALSLSSIEHVNARTVGFWPKDLQTQVYGEIFGMDRLWRSMGISIYITVAGTALCLLLSTSLAFALSRAYMPGRAWIMKGIIATFVFSIPMIPSYLVVKELSMENTLWSLIVPGALGAFYVVILKTFFQGISSELFDAAKIDGSHEISVYFRLVLPLSKPVLATMALFHAVGQWNSYFGALIFLRDRTLYPLQLVLRELVVEEQANVLVYDNPALAATTPEMMKAGVILFATLPIVMVYPFLQKHFVKGAMLGSLKE